jgi:hypothetical protein
MDERVNAIRVRERRGRVTGLLVLLIPVVAGVALNLFPNYDARAENFAESYPAIVDAGQKFPLALVLLLMVSALLGRLALALRRSQDGTQSGGVAVGGLVVSAAGFGLASLLSIPVWLWARQVADGTLTLAQGAQRSEALASGSQTVILMVGLGGLLVGFSALGWMAFRRSWVDPTAFWAALILSSAALIGGLALGLFWIGIGVPPVVWTLMIGSSLLFRGWGIAKTQIE